MFMIRTSASWLRLAVLAVAFSVLTACGGGGSDGASPLPRIEITPEAGSAPLGTTQQFTATAIYADDSHEDVTQQVTWSSSSVSVATIAGSGLASGKRVGQTAITATLGDAIGAATFTVTAAEPAALQLTPTTASVAKGLTVQLAATATFTDGTTRSVTAEADWASDKAAIASVGNDSADKGKVTGNGSGVAQITASFGTLSAHADVTVTNATPQALALAPSPATLPIGRTQQFTATATLSDGTTQDVTADSGWSSSDTAVVGISEDGLATAASAGSAEISATYAGLSANAPITVTTAVLQSLAVTPTMGSVPKGRTQAFTATGTYSDGTTQDLTSTVTWSSSDGNVATISNAAGSHGVAQAKAAGAATIKAVDALTTISAQANLTVTAAELVSLAVTPPAPSIAKGRLQQFAATGTYTDGSTRDVTTTVTWTSSNASVASISNSAGSQGLADADGTSTGTSTITATDAGSGIAATAELTVTASELVGLEVAPTAVSLPNGQSLQYSATGFYSDGSHENLTADVTWTSSNKAVAEISNASAIHGLALAKSTGTTNITASVAGQSASTSLVVTDATLTAIQIAPVNVKLANGFTRQYSAIGVFSDNSTLDITQTVTWSTTPETVATISNAAGSKGLATGVAAGATTVKATSGTGASAVSGSTALTVTSATLASIAVTPSNPTIAKGTTERFTATGTFSDGSTQNLTTQTSWTSSSTAVATVSNAAGSQGLATAVTTGSATISAAVGGVSGSTTLTVNDATLSKITVTPSPASVAKGTTLALTATGTYSDNSTADLSADVTWSSSDSSIATVTNGGGAATHGVVTGVAEGSVSVKAAMTGISGSTALTVTPATLSSIAVTPADQSVAKGVSVVYTAKGTYSDGSVADITSAVTWGSDDETVATVSNAGDASKGTASTVGTGSAAISASLGGVAGGTSLTVTSAVLKSIDITPKARSIPNGTTQQFKATGIYSDGSPHNLTLDVTWSSSNTGAATISNASGNQGLASSVAPGVTTIKATSGTGASAISSTTTLTVTSAALQRITIAPDAGVVPIGYFRQYRATGSYADGSTKDITAEVSWTSFDDTVATVSNAAGSRGRVAAVATGSTSVLASMAGISDSASVAVTSASLQSIAVTPADGTIAVGATLQFTATGTFSDASTLDMTQQVQWTSSNAGAATIDANGLATAGSGGLSPNTTIRASKAVSSTTTITGSTSLHRGS